MEIKNVVIISGASRGIGAAAAMKFAANRFNITLVGRDRTQLKVVEKQIFDSYGTQTLVCAGDLADLNFAQSVIDQTLSKWNRIDALVNNAAWRTIETMRTISPEIWDQTLKICITAPAFMAKWAAQSMEERKINGVIVNISSVMSSRAAGNSPAYVTAKGGMDSLTRELAITYGRSGIRVVTINPGFIDTTLSSDYVNEAGENISGIMKDRLCDNTPLSRAGTPEEVANAISWICSAEATFITGCSLLVDGGFSQNFSDYESKKMQFPKQF